MPGTSLAYRGTVRVATALLPLASAFDAKLRRGHEARRGALARLRAWAERERDRTGPLLWFHAPSVGEGLQAEAVLRRIRGRHPEWQLAYTHFSPSAEPLARRVGASVSDYLPYDTPAAARQLLDALAPTALIFSKLDLWPELATRAAARGIPVALIAATVRPGSGRLRWPARSLLAPGYRALRAVAAVDRPDADRLISLGAPREAVQVLGDPRFDSVAAKVAAVAADDPLLRFGRGAPTLVAGSTWPGDESALLEAFAAVRAKRPDARLILVPHEPTEHHLSAAEAWTRRAGLPAPTRLSRADGPTPLLLVDRVGVLAALYGAGSIAYVGGGFHAAGLHSVLEPAAWGIPVIFGPGWRDSRDAAALLEAGGADALPALLPGDALARTWERWIGDDAARAEAGRRARGVIERGLGAAARTAEMLEGLVEK
ncbi:MAG TPA: glycosyltransferase N-terminal domain-containing protein [Gemmatimonadales bacterium]|nr:glycosyltransferase N-terminal domain-containing protein [Gemmatimonadales bacterium]